MVGKHSKEHTATRKAFMLKALLSLAVTICALCACSTHSYTGTDPANSSTTAHELSDAPVLDERQAKTVVEEDTGSAEDELAEESKTPSETKITRMRGAEDAVRAIVDGYGESVALSVSYLDGSAGFSLREDEEYVSASMIKLLVLARFLEEESAGTIDAGQSYELAAPDIVGGTSHISGYPLGTTFSYDDLAEAMIAYSDNTAANVLIDALGMGQINDEAQELGLTETRLERKMMYFSGEAENYMSVRDAETLLVGFATGSIAGEEESARAMQYLLAQSDEDGLARGIPEEVPFAHKTGSLENVRHDGGVVYATDPYVIIVFTNMGGYAANDLMAKISSTVYSALVES